MVRTGINQQFESNDHALKDFITQQQRPAQISSNKPLGKTNCYIVGVGGGGNNTINRLMSTRMKDALCICINTDLQHLNSVKCDTSLLIGKKITRGLGCGGKPELGKAAAEESLSDIQKLLSDADIIFLTCGLGGGTGTGAAPIIAEIAKRAGAIVFSVVTMPFGIEGLRKEIAYTGLNELKKYTDTIVIIENDKLLEVVPDLPIEEAFSVTDEVLANYINSIITTVSQPGIINVDFADLKSILLKGGVTVCGVGEATGKDRAKVAVQKALENPLISVNFKTGAAALIYVTGGSTMTLKEASSVVELIREKIQPQAEIIWGTKVDHELGDLLRITVVISGVESEQIISNHKGDSSNLGLSTNPLLTKDRNNPQMQHQKENWLRKESITTLRDLRKRLQESKEKTATQKQKSPSEKEETSEFWDELGLSKGLD